MQTKSKNTKHLSGISTNINFNNSSISKYRKGKSSIDRYNPKIDDEVLVDVGLIYNNKLREPENIESIRSKGRRVRARYLGDKEFLVKNFRWSNTIDRAIIEIDGNKYFTIKAFLNKA